MMLADLNQRITKAESERRLFDYYPDSGPLRRDLYTKHLEFFANGKEHQERAFIAGNRVGKTTAAAYELTLHATGLYPEWWPGRKFLKPTVLWACGEDAKTVRDTIQVTLLGQPGQIGTGMIPAQNIISTAARSGVPEAVDSVSIRGRYGTSRLLFKGYDQGREAYQGAKVDGVWFDEEPPLPVYMEGLTRTMATVPGDENGCVLCTFTPLKGLSAVVMLFLPGGQIP